MGGGEGEVDVCTDGKGRILEGDGDVFEKKEVVFGVGEGLEEVVSEGRGFDLGFGHWKCLLGKYLGIVCLSIIAKFV